MASRMKIRKDDQVKVISGKDRGKTGTVLRTEPERQRVYVQGLNIQKRHQRPQQLQDTQRTSQIEGGVIEVGAFAAKGKFEACFAIGVAVTGAGVATGLGEDGHDVVAEGNGTDVFGARSGGREEEGGD